MSEPYAANAIYLSREELVYALRSLGLPDLPGLGPKPLGDVDAPAAALLAEAGRRALLARRLLQPGTDHLYRLDKTVQAGLMLCAYPERMLSVSAILQNTAPVQEYFYISPELTIHHSQPEAGIHAFFLSAASSCGLEAVLKRLEGNGAVFQTTEYALIQARLDEAYQLAGANTNAAAASLGKIGMPPADAAALAAALAGPELRLALHYVFQTRPQVETLTLTFLVGAETLWQVKADPAGGQIVRLQALPASSAAVLVKAAHQRLLANEGSDLTP